MVRGWGYCYYWPGGQDEEGPGPEDDGGGGTANRNSYSSSQQVWSDLFCARKRYWVGMA